MRCRVIMRCKSRFACSEHYGATSSSMTAVRLLPRCCRTSTISAFRLVFLVTWIVFSDFLTRITIRTTNRTGEAVSWFSKCFSTFGFFSFNEYVTQFRVRFISHTTELFCDHFSCSLLLLGFISTRVLALDDASRIITSTSCINTWLPLFIIRFLLLQGKLNKSEKHHLNKSAKHHLNKSTKHQISLQNTNVIYILLSTWQMM